MLNLTHHQVQIFSDFKRILTMKTFLALITRDEFAALYKFGSINLSTKIIREVNETINLNHIAYDLLKSSVCRIEYPQEYIYVLMQKTEQDEIVRVADIVALIPLTEQAKDSYVELFDKAICFQHPIFAPEFEKYYADIYLREDRINGIRALRHICDLSVDKLDEQLISQILDGVILRQKGTKYFNIPWEERKPFSMLIAYDRYQEYSKHAIGYFYDVVDMYYYLKSPDNIGDRDESVIGQEVMEILENRTGKIEGICNDIENDPSGKGKKVCEKIAGIFDGFYLPVLYLSFKDKIREKNEIDAEIIDNLKKYRKEERVYDKITYLLGGFFGYEKIYEQYYKSLNLKIFDGNFDINSFMDPSATSTDTKGYHHNGDVEKSVEDEGILTAPEESFKERIMELVKRVTPTESTHRKVNEFLSKDASYELLKEYLNSSAESDSSKLVSDGCPLTNKQLSRLWKEYKKKYCLYSMFGWEE